MCFVFVRCLSRAFGFSSADSAGVVGDRGFDRDLYLHQDLVQPLEAPVKGVQGCRRPFQVPTTYVYIQRRSVCSICVLVGLPQVVAGAALKYMHGSMYAHPSSVGFGPGFSTSGQATSGIVILSIERVVLGVL